MRNNRPTSKLRSIRGPITLITLGALFALQNFTPYGFDQTWPVLLIVFGLMTLVGKAVAPPPEPPVGVPPNNPYQYAPPPGGYYPPPAAGSYAPPAAAGGYRSTPYAQASDPQTQPAAEDAAAAKGGFGTTAAPRGGEQPGSTGGTR